MPSVDDYSFHVGYERAVTFMFRAQVKVLCSLIQHYPSLWTWGDGYGGYVRLTLEEAFEEHGFPQQPKPTSPGNKRKSLSRSKLIAVMQKSDGRCAVCNESSNLHVDHIVPLSRGGSYDLENLQMLCADCNMSKGTKTMDEWLGDHE